MTPDQMNTEALLQSRDYFAASTGFSDTAGSKALQFTHSLQETGDSRAETGMSDRTDVTGGKASAAAAGGTSTEDELRATFNVPRRVITIPTVSQFDNGGSGSEDEPSELSIGR